MVKELIPRARELILQKRYEDARILLYQLEHPTARKWLKQLDSISPKPKLKDNQQLASLLDITISDVIDVLGGTQAVSDRAKSWVLTKRDIYAGGQYLEQLEKNAVYFVEATGSTKIAIAQYLKYGTPDDLAYSEINQYVEYIGKVVPQKEVHAPLLAFLRGYLPQQPDQLSTWDWHRIKNMRETKSSSDYVKELEIICWLNQVATTLADACLSVILHNPNTQGSARLLELHHVVAVTNARLDYWANYCVGNVILNPQIEKRVVKLTSENWIALLKNLKLAGKIADVQWKTWYATVYEGILSELVSATDDSIVAVSLTVQDWQIIMGYLDLICERRGSQWVDWYKRLEEVMFYSISNMKI